MSNITDPTLSQAAAIMDTRQATEAAALLGMALEVLLDEIGTPEPDAEIAMLEKRALEIEEDLRDPFIRSEKANALLDELADIDKRLAPFGSARWFENVPEIAF